MENFKNHFSRGGLFTKKTMGIRFYPRSKDRMKMLSVAKRRRFKLLKQKSNPRVEFVLQKKVRITITKS